MIVTIIISFHDWMIADWINRENFNYNWNHDWIAKRD